MSITPRPEFSRPVSVAEMKPGETVIDIEAGPEERAALAERFDLLALGSLSATATLVAPLGAPEIRLEAEFEADITQSCVVTLEPVRSLLRGRLHRRFAPAPAEPDEREIEIRADTEDPPDPIIDGVIDIGEAVAEELALAIDPFPRSAGARFEGYSSEGGKGEDSSKEYKPFAGLRDLLRRSE